MCLVTHKGSCFRVLSESPVYNEGEQVPDLQLVHPPRKIRHYGFRRSLPRIEPFADVGGLTILPEVDPRGELPPVEDQGQLGSCTANATASCFRYDAILDGNDPGQLCRFFIYYGERKLEGDLGQGDTGAEGHDAFTVAQSGIPDETAWPYTWPGGIDAGPPDNSVFDPPSLPASVVDAPVAYTLNKPVVAVPQSQQAIQAVLSNKQTVAMGFTVYESFESSVVANSGIVPMPTQAEKVVGGHEVLIVGYLQSDPNHALVMNSWGTSWGLSGFCRFPWTYICNPQLASDLRTITRPAV